MYIIKNLSAAV